MLKRYPNFANMTKKEFVAAEANHLREQLEEDLKKPWGKDAVMLPMEMLRQMATGTWEIAHMQSDEFSEIELQGMAEKIGIDELQKSGDLMMRPQGQTEVIHKDHGGTANE